MQARQTAIACRLMRGGNSKGALFLAEDLPQEVALRDRVLLAVMGAPDTRQIDGLGGTDPRSSGVAIVSRSERPGADVNYLYAQVASERPLVDVSRSCGDMLAAVAPFAIERGLVSAADPTTRLAIYLQNSGTVALAAVETPGGMVHYAGGASMAGVPGTGAPIHLEFPDASGPIRDARLPTRNARDPIGRIEVTCIDNGLPVVIVSARSVGKSGYESIAELEADRDFTARLEALRLAAGVLMGLGDVSDRAVPCVILIAPSQAGGRLCTRSFIGRRCDPGIGVLEAISLATACVLPGSVAAEMAAASDGPTAALSLEHPGGELSVQLDVTAIGAADCSLGPCSVVCTARTLMEGSVLIPPSIWDGARYFGR